MALAGRQSQDSKIKLGIGLGVKGIKMRLEKRVKDKTERRNDNPSVHLNDVSIWE